ncbi:hypothetical protein GQ53DRAFT_741647 [Thozetella sp. PMI_491]|nr:hypothetical protein GQ53DRAFT_741647 [Thozetella sp. PMI_491]
MSSPSPTSPKRKPRLSLQIKAISGSSSVRNSRTLAAAVDVKDHTTFNTLTNVYATAIDRSTPIKEKNDSWGTALNPRPALRLQTQDNAKDPRMYTPYLGPYLDTPLSAHPMSPAAAKEIVFPSAVAMTATPPLSATATDPNTKVFTFEPRTASREPASAKPPATPRTSRRRSTLPNKMLAAPYTHPRSLHSILRNSPLPPLSNKSPVSPRRQSLRLQEKAARRVAYNSPLCQTITTTKYTRSHIDLLTDDRSPCTPGGTESPSTALDITMAYTNDETRDGGETPGPFEEMRRRIAGLTTSSPLSPTGGGIRKKGKKKEKKRRWVWTIGEDAGEERLESPDVVKAAGQETPKFVSALVLPSPGPQTRAQVAAATTPVKPPSVPVIALPVPKRARSSAISIPSIALPVPPVPVVPAAASPAMVPQLPVPKPRRRVTLEVPPAERPVSPIQRVIEELPATPPETTSVIEPPTPSVDSTMSQDSVFSPHGDVEMSDASSFMSVEDTPLIEHKFMAGDDEMDMDTPTATEPTAA